VAGWRRTVADEVFLKDKKSVKVAFDRLRSQMLAPV
jgi:hypothetical protein